MRGEPAAAAAFADVDARIGVSFVRRRVAAIYPRGFGTPIVDQGIATVRSSACACNAPARAPPASRWPATDGNTACTSSGNAIGRPANSAHARAAASNRRPARGESPLIPLAGLPKDHIATQMRAFRDGKRPATVMHQIAKGYSDPQIDALAAWFSAQKR